jgi:hypothetical protein
MFTTNPAGSAVVNAIGPIRQVVRAQEPAQRRYLVIAAGTADKPGAAVQVQAAAVSGGTSPQEERAHSPD